MDSAFTARAARIPVRGLGLSVDVFSPDLPELCRALDQAGPSPSYLEIFKAPARELARIRAALPGVPLEYHAEGLWLIDPEAPAASPWTAAIETIARHTEVLGASWANHECAGKQFAGFSFGTYLPPLFTAPAARAAAANAAAAQAAIDEWYAGKGASPLLLLELPPLTYFGLGDLPVAEFFSKIADEAACGLVLDVGHLWTHWRYRERRRYRRLESFVEDFLAAFPLSRVVQIHLAGLGTHDGDGQDKGLPFWIDRHDAPVPETLYDLLRQILAHGDLPALRGLALEVDTKQVVLIAEEFGRFRNEFDPLFGRARSGSGAGMYRATDTGAMSTSELSGQYAAYARLVSGQPEPAPGALSALIQDLDPQGLALYTGGYLPDELVRWGGDLSALFPELWRELGNRGIAETEFVRFWFKESRPIVEPYDFFYVKLDRWVEFVAEVASDLAERAAKEAAILRGLHAELNDELAVPERLG